MSRKPPTLNKQGVPAFFANEDDRNASFFLVDREQHSVATEKPQLALCHGVRSKGFQMSCLSDWILHQTGDCSFQHSTTLFDAKCPQVVDH